MKKLELNGILLQKLGRLTQGVDELRYIGCDLSEYQDLKFVGIVGTRKPTAYGKIMTRRLAEDLAKQNVVIVSGLALGVDSIAHQATVDIRGRAIAVLPSGLNNIYPATNRRLAKSILDLNGSIVSEYPDNHHPRKIEFLQRNRIIAALSDAVIVTEAAANSGSLNTANHAKLIGVPVFALPGNANSPLSEGSNQLLKEGALPITQAEDMLNFLGVNKSNKQTKLNLIADTPSETIILQKIALGFNSTEEIISETSLSINEFQSNSTLLEIQGRIFQDNTGKWYLK